MTFQQRQTQFKQAVAARPEVTGGVTKFADAFGFSNSAKVIERGLFAFNVNFDQFPAATEKVVIHCVLRFPPEDEIYFALIIRSGVQTLRERLTSMRAAGTPSTSAEELEEPDAGEGLFAAAATVTAAAPAATGNVLTYTSNNKNVKGYIALDGRLYLRNKQFWDVLPEDLSSVPMPVEIDTVLFSIWPPAASARHGLFAREFIGYLGSLIGHDKIHELRVWTDAQGVSPQMQRMPASIPVADIESAISAMGGHYPGGEVRRFHAALNFLQHKHFVILSGLSGTGKSQLASMYAKAVHGITGEAAPDPFLCICPVRPEWTDPTALTGYYDVLSNRYIVPPFLAAVLLAIAHSATPVFIVLDEMNLARVEYYLSDVLSCMETKGGALKLHSSSVPLEGSNGTPIPDQLPLPENLFLIGTINVDETTNPVSDKVLDRAMVIDMSAVDAGGFLDALSSRDTALAAGCAAARTHLVPAHTVMMEHGLGFGYRAIEEFVRYHNFSATYLSGTANDVTDELMVQKLLVKLRGSERQRPLLTGLQSALNGLSKSQEFLSRLITDLDEFGSFQAAR